MEMSQQKLKEIQVKIMDFIRKAREPQTLEQIAKAIEYPVGEVEIAADRLLEIGVIQYIPTGGGNWGFAVKIT
jgi:hypothetical protein